MSFIQIIILQIAIFCSVWFIVILKFYFAIKFQDFLYFLSWLVQRCSPFYTYPVYKNFFPKEYTERIQTHTKMGFSKKASRNGICKYQNKEKEQKIHLLYCDISILNQRMTWDCLLLKEHIQATLAFKKKQEKTYAFVSMKCLEMHIKH